MPDWSRGDLREELLSHGFRYLEQEGTRGNTFVQMAVEELIQEHEWPFRLALTVFTPLVPIDGLGKVQQVLIPETGKPLEPVREDWLRDQYNDLGVTGTPRYYYLYNQRQLSVYPYTADDMWVRHFSLLGWIDSTDNQTPLRTPNLDADYPVVPHEFRDLIVLLARTYAKEDAGNMEEAMALRERYVERLEDMRGALMTQQVDELKRVRRTTEFA